MAAIADFKVTSGMAVIPTKLSDDQLVKMEMQSIGIPPAASGGTDKPNSILPAARGGNDKPLSMDPVKLFTEFGLGRGVDATSATPFLNKKAFQVYPIYSEDDIVCTNEGSALKSICENLECIDTLSTQLIASLTTPQVPLTIEATVEHSKSVILNGYALGRSVITRTIEFRNDRFADEKTTWFEQYIKKWLLANTEGPGAKTDQVDLLLKFVAMYGITHFVSKIQLGAAEYRTMSEQIYNRFISGKQDLGVDIIVQLATSRKKDKKMTSQVSEIKRIGFMNGDCVVRRDTQDEAVVNVELEVIANLIHEKNLKRDLSQALFIYIYSQLCFLTGYKPPRTRRAITALGVTLNASNSKDQETDIDTTTPEKTDVPLNFKKKIRDCAKGLMHHPNSKYINVCQCTKIKYHVN